MHLLLARELPLHPPHSSHCARFHSVQAHCAFLPFRTFRSRSLASSEAESVRRDSLIHSAASAIPPHWTIHHSSPDRLGFRPSILICPPTEAIRPTRHRTMNCPVPCPCGQGGISRMHTSLRKLRSVPIPLPVISIGNTTQEYARSIPSHFSHCARFHFVQAHCASLHSGHSAAIYLLPRSCVSQPGPSFRNAPSGTRLTDPIHINQTPDKPSFATSEALSLTAERYR